MQMDFMSLSLAHFIDLKALYNYLRGQKNMLIVQIVQSCWFLIYIYKVFRHLSGILKNHSTIQLRQCYIPSCWRSWVFSSSVKFRYSGLSEKMLKSSSNVGRLSGLYSQHFNMIE